MARTIDKLIVVDVEATCWDNPPPIDQQMEIIEIGMTPVNLKMTGNETPEEYLQPGESSSILVRPKFSTVSKFCTSLTSLTQQDVDHGVSFRDACLRLKTFKNRTWGSWGDYDRRQFERQCRARRFKSQYPFGPTHLNIKNLFAIIMGLPKEVGMDVALEMLGIELEGTHHRAGDDSGNIAKIVCRILSPAREALYPW